MKVLAALALVGLMMASGAQDASAQDKTARLDDPAITGPGIDGRVLVAPREGQIRQGAMPAPARPLGFSSVEVNGIRDAIRGQIMALAARDAKQAWSYLAPSTQTYFNDPTVFLTTLATQMKPLTSPQEFAFSGIEREATDAVQDVILSDVDGREWLARFTMERQPDGRWGIKTCKVEPVVGSRI